MVYRIWTAKSQRKSPAYNGLGQRVSQEVSSVVTEYLLDVQPGLYKVIAATASGNTDRFIHDPMGIAQHEDNSSNWHWMLKDGLGTVRGVYDNALSEVYAADRDPYGDLITATGSNPTPFEYTGEPEDQNGLLHLRARYYDPELGAFNSLDPVETENRYAYVGGDPVNFADPTGNSRACSPGGSGTAQQPPIPTPDIPGPYVSSSRVPFCLEVCGQLSEPHLSDCFVRCYSEPVSYCNSMAPGAEPYKSDAFVGCINGDHEAYSSAWLAWSEANNPTTPSVSSPCDSPPDPTRYFTVGIRLDTSLAVVFGTADLNVERHCTLTSDSSINVPIIGGIPKPRLKCGWFANFAVGIDSSIVGANLNGMLTLGFISFPPPGTIAYTRSVGGGGYVGYSGEGDITFTDDRREGVVSFGGGLGFAFNPLTGPANAYYVRGASVYLGEAFYFEDIPNCAWDKVEEAIINLLRPENIAE